MVQFSFFYSVSRIEDIGRKKKKTIPYTIVINKKNFTFASISFFPSVSRIENISLSKFSLFLWKEPTKLWTGQQQNHILQSRGGPWLLNIMVLHLELRTNEIYSLKFAVFPPILNCMFYIFLSRKFASSACDPHALKMSKAGQ